MSSSTRDIFISKLRAERHKQMLDLLEKFERCAKKVKEAGFEKEAEIKLKLWISELESMAARKSDVTPTHQLSGGEDEHGDISDEKHDTGYKEEDPARKSDILPPHQLSGGEDERDESGDEQQDGDKEEEPAKKLKKTPLPTRIMSKPNVITPDPSSKTVQTRKKYEKHDTGNKEDDPARKSDILPPHQLSGGEDEHGDIVDEKHDTGNKKEDPARKSDILPPHQLSGGEDEHDESGDEQQDGDGEEVPAKKLKKTPRPQRIMSKPNVITPDPSSKTVQTDKKYEMTSEIYDEDGVPHEKKTVHSRGEFTSRTVDPQLISTVDTDTKLIFLPSFVLTRLGPTYLGPTSFRPPR
uniref:Uncharacterized protein n=1 Tax=Ditylenchus dipsaci TaxID=166011 RepID=A0A915DU92_9BILA